MKGIKLGWSPNTIQIGEILIDGLSSINTMCMWKIACVTRLANHPLHYAI